MELASSIILIITGIILLICYVYFPYSKEDDYGKNFSYIGYGILFLIVGIVMLIKYL